MTQNAPYFHDGAELSLSQGEYIDVFSLLGMHQVKQGKGLVVRCFLRGAIAVDVISHKDGRKVASLDKVNDEGVFAGTLGRRVNPFIYRLRISYPLAQLEIIDPYQFDSILNHDDVYLLGEGNQQYAYRFLGANWQEQQGVAGVHFCVWAPNAKRVSLLGDFNDWDSHRNIMRQHMANGLWEIFIPSAMAGQHYKFEIITQDNQVLHKADPYAKVMQCSPQNASLISEKDTHQWRDQEWMQRRSRCAASNHIAPMSTYEVHLGSWRRQGREGQDYLDYPALIEQLIPYVKEMGFTHLQLMPVSEYPFDGSWGYQPVGLFAPSYRFGSPNGLKEFIDACHQAGIAVILDWVAAHFPRDPHGIGRFDGTALYEHADPRLGEHPDWGTLIYNYDRGEVKSYLLSNACYWLEEFHFDGLRLDAVSSMLYLDYSREPGQWVPNVYGGRENLAAIHFLQDLNQRLYLDYPGINMIAEESTSFSGVTKPVVQGGLGFGFKWNMGWMNDTLCYLARDPMYRRYHHNEMTFGLMYSFSEQFILPISHDEVVHGKGTLLSRIPGDDWQKFATLRAYLGFMWGHPGKKLIFMGQEFAQRGEWDHNKSLDWHLLEYGQHQQVQQWMKDLNQCYRSSSALWAQDAQAEGFQWLDGGNADHSIFSFVRWGTTADEHLIFIVNMTPQVHHGFRIGLPSSVRYQELLNSDSEFYGGSNQGNTGLINPEPTPWQGMDYSSFITVPPLACLVLQPQVLLAKGTESSLEDA